MPNHSDQIQNEHNSIDHNAMVKFYYFTNQHSKLKYSCIHFNYASQFGVQSLAQICFTAVFYQKLTNFLYTRMRRLIKNHFRQILQQFSDPAKSKRLYKKAENLYLMRSFKVKNVSSEQAIESYDRLEAKYQSGELKTITNDWHKNERKLFIWYLICYCEQRKTTIQDLVQHLSNQTDKEWDQMGSIFFCKSPLFLKFQGLSILKNTKRHNWSEQDDQQLKKFVAQINSNEWNSISKSIFFESDKGKFISAKQCRERWFNHISKEINKNQWTNQQDVRILKLTLEIGKKWSQIARLLSTHRTEHMVKNRFNSIINKIRRKKMQNQQSLTKKALNMLQNEQEEKPEMDAQIQKSQKDIKEEKEAQKQSDKQKQKVVIQIVPKSEDKQQQVTRTSFLKRFPSKESEGDQYNLSDLPEGDLKDLKNFISKKDRGYFSFNADESVQLQNPEQVLFSVATPNSTVSPGITPFYMAFENFFGRKEDGGQLMSPAPPQCYSPAGGFFSTLSPGFDVLSLIERDKNGLNSSKQYFSSSLFTPVPNEYANDAKMTGHANNANKKQRKELNQ